MKLLVRNLTRTITETELLALFEAHGEVQSCDLVMDQESGKSKGFGFVEMADDSAAQAAIDALNGTKQAGNKIRVKAADEKPEAPAEEQIWPEQEGE
ncbi:MULTISPECIES: RNA recognition motif domain-containing protein [unclassified Agarivorans]|uniref:RNA recognition motif domain-containing protein n=1 Tax=unclassified Agarivorans TaxID=2636026 RepID=UPI0026E1C006|nr:MULTISPECIES: RNA-binding protein [unclassified Agarivorans]MDO6684185.1 RNA-binding protein [Agarivorans sp. 3_MG-2023]MDO6714081.1 RNA-binding protein [Agarivorans sp. 2_MG-2023]